MSEFTKPIEIAVVIARKSYAVIGEAVLNLIDRQDTKLADIINPEWERDTKK